VEKLMYTLLIVLFVFVCAAMVVVILLQAGKGQGLAGTFGGPGAGAVFGGRGAATFLSKATGILATLYLCLCLLIGYVYRSQNEGQRESLIQQNSQETVPESSVPLAPLGIPPADSGQ
jgi:preprotein translocase subunit SecG